MVAISEVTVTQFQEPTCFDICVIHLIILTIRRKRRIKLLSKHELNSKLCYVTEGLSKQVVNWMTLGHSWLAVNHHTNVTATNNVE